MLVPITEEDRNSAYYKYFSRPMAPVAQEKYDKIKAGPVDPKTMLHVQDMNVLFNEGYLPGEFGYARVEDKSIVVANLTQMPGVTVEMFDWWFAWHGLAPIRYKMWDPEDHFYCLTRNPEQARDTSLSLKERYWNTIHDVVEDTTAYDVLGGKSKKAKIAITFRNPADIGFDKEKLKNFDGTIVCAGNEKAPAIMCHFVRTTENGCELRTRFWFGYCVKNGKPTKCTFPMASLLSLSMAQRLLAHNVKEYSNLAAILPEAYAEFRNQF